VTAEFADLVRDGMPAGSGVTVEGETITVSVPAPDWIAALRFARDGAGCDFFDWLTGVDEGDTGFGVVAHLYSIEGRRHVIARTVVERGAPVLASAVEVFAGAAWHERETHEMFGVVFEGHPGLEPLLLPDGFTGYPLRKDYWLADRQAKEWPGSVEPGERDVPGRPRRKMTPPGVPG